MTSIHIRRFFLTFDMDEAPNELRIDSINNWDSVRRCKKGASTPRVMKNRSLVKRSDYKIRTYRQAVLA
jgi:hypothetical protein